MVAEQYLKEAGADVISTDEYYKKYHQKNLKISPWEGHPNELANWIWATMIEESFNKKAKI